MLELRIGSPRWYNRAVCGATLALIFALFVNRVQLEYSIAIMIFAVLIVASDWLGRRKNKKFEYLLIGRDFSLTVCDAAGKEYPAQKAGVIWVSSSMIIFPLRLDSGPRFFSVVSAHQNDPDAFRRFTIICRFGFAVADSDRHNETQFNPQGIMK